MNQLLHVSASPHIKDRVTTSSIMLDVIIALIPATLFGIIQFKINALLIIVTTITTCVLAEYLYERFMKKTITIKDLSAVVTGLILALNLPSTVPLWLPVIGGLFAIIVVKQFYGGLGQNFMNPALAARCFLLISFTGRMTNFVFDGMTSSTPLAILKNGESFDLIKMFIGNTAGTIGETSAIALLIGAMYLIVKKVIKVTIPLTYLLTFSIFTLIFVGLLMYTGRDYGPMLKAEARALTTGQYLRPEAKAMMDLNNELGEAKMNRPLIRCFVLPILIAFLPSGIQD